MGTTKPANWQLTNIAALKTLGKPALSTDDTIIDGIDAEFTTPLRMRASFPTADSKLNFEPSVTASSDGGKKSLAPLKSQVFNLAATTLDFQTQASTGASFVITWPTTNNVGQFRRVGFTLLGNGSIQALFSAEAATQGALTNAGTLFVKSGIALGFIDIVCTDNTTIGKYKTAGSVANVIENAQISRFSSGSGGGSASGGGFDFETFMGIRLNESYFQYGTPVIFEASEQTYVDAVTTSTYNLVDSTYDYSVAAQNLTTKQLFASSFLASQDESARLELLAEWFDDSSRDDAATYSLSLDGGLSWQTVSMGRIGLSQKFVGRILMDVPAATSIYSQTTNNSTKELNATNQISLAQKITTTDKFGMRGIAASVTKTGSPDGSYIISVKKDNAGVPGDTIYSTTALCSTLATGANSIALTGFKNIMAPGTYWIMVETDATYRSTFAPGTKSIAVGADSAGSGFTYNGATWSTLAAFGMFYNLTGFKYDLRARAVSSAGSKKLKAIGVLFDEQIGAVGQNILQQQSFVFSGDLNTFSFNVTRFLPDSRLLKIYDIYTGQTYRYPAFTLDGKTVKFASGTFLVPGKEINLLFDQSEGVGYDNSDTNLALLTANRLGSSDASIDRSVAGRGILLRNAAGVLQELWLDENNNVNVTAPKG